MSAQLQIVEIFAKKEATESFMTDLFEDSYMCFIHAKKLTIMPKDKTCNVFSIQDTKQNWQISKQQQMNKWISLY